MKIIEKLSDMIQCELDGADKYAECALLHKDERPQLAESLYSISLDKMKHVSLLHTQVVNIITEYKKQSGEPPEGMQTLYDYLHRKQIEYAAEIKAKQALYKE